MFHPKDFIASPEGLVFAVVTNLMEEGRVLCFLRYVRYRDGWRKVNTDEANELLRQKHPDFLFYSNKLHASLHAVPVESIDRHFRPRQRLASLMQSVGGDVVEQDCRRLCSHLQKMGVAPERVGVTGSLLPGFQQAASDIDLVFYGRDTFRKGRLAVQALLRQGICQPLSDEDWLESYRRRDCHLDLDEYVWHERRKYNKAMFNGRKFDLNMVIDDAPKPATPLKKLGAITIRARVSDDRLAFDYPAEFLIDHDDVERVMCFTATYTGQAEKGEWIEVAGQLEQTEDGRRWIVVGSTREARGEFIRVLRDE